MSWILSPGGEIERKLVDLLFDHIVLCGYHVRLIFAKLLHFSADSQTRFRGQSKDIQPQSARKVGEKQKEWTLDMDANRTETAVYHCGRVRTFWVPDL